MPGASSGSYLPPIIAELQADASDMAAKIAEMKALLEDLSKTPTSVTITADAAQAIAEMAAARTELNAMALPPITYTIAINSAQALAELAVIRAIAGSMAPVAIPVTANIAPLIAEMAVAKAAADSQGGGIGIIGRLLWGAGGLAGFAAFGSLASLAGFGFEHALTMMIGLAGSLAGALGGLGILAVGVFGKMAVGMGSDMLVMKSTIADTQLLSAGLTAIQTAQLTYGKNSAQAAAATQALNVQMLLLGNTSGVQAELGLAKAGQALNAFWDQATSAARVAAVGFIEPFLSVAYTYIPLIAAAATRNFTIMTAAFKPLIAWANGPGTAIFKNLENLFAASIPIGVAALTNFVELLAKVANWAAPQSGGVMASIEKFLAYLNSAPGFAKLEGVMTTMVGMFHDWWDLLKQVAITIYDLFSQSAGLGTNIVTTITGMLVQLDKWLTSTSGKASVHNLFTLHLQEIDAILRALPTVIGAFGQLYLAIAPPLVVLVTGIADLVGWMLKIPVVGNILAWGAAIAFLANKMGLFTAAGWIMHGGIQTLIGDLQNFAGKIAGAVANVATWIASAARSSAAWLVSAAKTIASFVATAAAYVVNSVKMFAELVAKSAARAAIWLAEQAKAIASFVATAASYVARQALMLATMVAKSAARLALWLLEQVKAIASFVATAAAYLLNQMLMSNSLILRSAARVVLWIAEQVKAIASFVATAVGYAVSSGVMLAKTIATTVAMAALWLATQVKAIASFVATSVAFGARMIAMETMAAAGALGVEASFLAMLGPIGLVMAAAVALAAVFLWLINNKPSAASLKQSGTTPGTVVGPTGGVTGVGHALGGVIAAGSWGTVGEIGMESAYAMPGGGVQIYPNPGGFQGGGNSGGVTIHAPVTITVQGGPTNAATGATVEQAVYNAMQRTIRQMKGGAKNYGFMPS